MRAAARQRRDRSRHGEPWLRSPIRQSILEQLQDFNEYGSPESDAAPKTALQVAGQPHQAAPFLRGRLVAPCFELATSFRNARAAIAKSSPGNANRADLAAVPDPIGRPASVASLQLWGLTRRTLLRTHLITLPLSPARRLCADAEPPCAKRSAQQDSQHAYGSSARAKGLPC